MSSYCQILSQLKVIKSVSMIELRIEMIMLNQHIYNFTVPFPTLSNECHLKYITSEKQTTMASFLQKKKKNTFCSQLLSQISTSPHVTRCFRVVFFIWCCTKEILHDQSLRKKLIRRPAGSISVGPYIATCAFCLACHEGNKPTLRCSQGL